MTQIRQADDTDIPALHALADASGVRKEPDYFQRCLQEQDAGRRQVFVISSGGRDAGYGMLNWQPQYALYRRLGIPEIQDLNVIPQERRKGLASALIAHCENLAREKNSEHVGISVGLYADYGPAQRLYTRLGYIPDGYGVTYDRQPVTPGEIRPVDDNLCLMMIKDL